MIRFIFLFILIFSVNSAIHAQDIILKRNGEELKVKITEINSSEIIFKYYDSLNRADYMILKAEVFMIKYANGTKEIITSAPVDGSSSRQSRKQMNGLIEKSGNSYYENDARLSERSLYDLMAESKNTRALNEMDAARTAKRTGTALIIAGIPLGSVGMVGFVLGGIMKTFDVTTDPTVNAIFTGGIVAIAAGVLCIVSGVVIKSQSKEHISNAVKLYNDDRKKMNSMK